MFKQIIMAVALGAMATGSAFAAVTARVGHAMPESHPQAAAMNKFVELAGNYTNNNVQIKAFHSALLGSDEKMLQAVQSGTQEFYIGTLAPLSTRVKEVQVWDLPFLFANGKGGSAAIDEWYRPYAAKEMKDVKFCFAFVHDPGTFHARKKITLPTDIKGMKVGIPKEYRVDGTSEEIVALWSKGMDML